ncbi:MAG TPA: cytochrome c oxidase subunit II [Candidatus Deferrimicrobium sp.]|nr:cytochrome c oxidase subunit II [Candidatus Deferrimicrobium sp.]
MDTTSSLFLPPAGSTIAPEVDALFNFILYTGVILFLIVTLATLWFIIRYRRRARTGTTSGIAHSTPLEIAWTAIPTVLILIVFFWGFKTYIKMNIVPKDALEIKVTGQRWFWTFDYPEGASSTNELVIPVGKPVKLLLSSKDVIHSFFVPDFRVKMDAVPNRYTITWFEATRAGEFNLFCTEYCGKGHSEMIGKVKAVSEREYADWLEAGSRAGEGVPLEEYGVKLYVKKACNTCHTVDGSASVAPTFKGLFGHEVFLTNGTRVPVDENYIRESILNPQAKIVTGFQPVMPTYQGLVKDRELDALIAYIKSLQQ